MSIEPNKKWLPLIIGLVLILLVAGIQVTTGGGTSGIVACNNPPSLLQCGTGICHEMNHSFCVMSNTFKTPFDSAPKNVSAVINGITSDAAGTIPLGLNYYVPGGSVTFQADNGETWTNMPSPLTELYGNTNHETMLGLPNNLGIGATGAEAQLHGFFSVNCLVGSTNATAYVKPQFLQLSTGVWTDLSAVPNALNIAIDAANDCPLPVVIGVGPVPLNHNYNNTFASVTPLRVVGVNGGGVGDAPILNMIVLDIAAPQFLTFTICTPLKFVCPNVSTLDSKTTIYFEIDWNVPAGGLVSYPYVWVDWTAWQ